MTQNVLNAETGDRSEVTCKESYEKHLIYAQEEHGKLFLSKYHSVIPLTGSYHCMEPYSDDSLQIP